MGVVTTPIMIISTGGSTIKPSSIEALVKEERPLYTQALSGYFQVHGKLLFLEINSPYQHEHEDKEKLPSYGESIGRFVLSGVVEQEGHVLAFRYKAKETFQPGTSWKLGLCPEGPEGIEKKDPEWLQRSRRAGFSKYLHLRAALEQPNVIIHLRGGIEYAPPRLFDAEGIYVDGGSLKYRHGDIDGKDFVDKPELR